LGSGEEGCLCDCDPDSRGWESPNHEFLPSEVSQMEVKFQDRSMKPWVSPRPDPVVGTQGGLKVERGRLSLAPLGSEGRVESPNGSNASAVLGLVVGRFKRRTAYRVSSFDGVVRLVAVLLHRVAMSSRGSVVYVNGRKLARYLGLSGVVHPIDLSAIYSLMEKLGFEVVRTSRGVTAVISMDKPVMKEVKAAKSIDEVIMTVKKYLGE